MSNKVKNKLIYRATAILLMFIMTAGAFSTAVFAEESAPAAAPAAAAENSTSESAAEKKEEKKEEKAEEKTDTKTDQSSEKKQDSAEQKKDTSADKSDKDSSEKKPSASESSKADSTASESAEKEKSSSSDKSDAAESESSDKSADAAEEAVSDAPSAAGTAQEPQIAGNSADELKAPVLRAYNSAVYLPEGVTAYFTKDDGTPGSWTGEKENYGYYIPAGSPVRLEKKTDADKCVFTATKNDGSQISISNNSFTMPDDKVEIGVQLYYAVRIDLTDENLPDGTSVTVNGKTVTKGQSDSVSAQAGTAISFSVSTSATAYDVAAVNSKTGEAVTVSGNSFTMPEANVDLTVNTSYNLNMDLTAPNVPDGFYVTINGTKVSKGEKKTINAATGGTFKIEEIATLEGVNYRTDRPGGTTHVRMRLSYGGGSSIVPIPDMQSSGYRMPSSNVDASLFVQHRWKITFTGDLYTCSVDNLTDGNSPWYGSAGDKIRINLDRASCRAPIEVTVTDTSGNLIGQASVDSDSYVFTMPDSPVNVAIKGMLARTLYNVNIVTVRNGTLKIDNTKQPEGLPVRVQAIPDKGYAMNPGGFLVAYKRGSQAYRIKPAQDENDKNVYTFTMPSADVSLSCVFVKPYVVKVKTNNGGKVKVDYKNPYGDYSTRGRDVFLKVTPKKGYVVKSWVARDADGKKVDIEKDGCITMPDSDVTVAVVFGKKSSGSSGGSSYISDGTESYYTEETLPEDGEEVDENITPEELLNLVPLTSAIAARTVLAVSSGINLMMSR